MKGLLVRVGCDSTRKFGHWNAPVDTESWEFVYVPKPEPGEILPELQQDYAYTKAMPFLGRFAERHGTSLNGLRFPEDLPNETMHLDPDFEYLTYGDKYPRNSKMKEMDKGDIIAFYSGLKPIKPLREKTVYALIGIYILKEKARLAKEIHASLWKQNAHTRRKTKRCDDEKGDLVVWAEPSLSGRLKKCIPIGEWRNRAYRVTEDLLKEWGGISSKDGYIQRSAVPPEFNNTMKFYSWFKSHSTGLEQRNF